MPSASFRTELPTMQAASRHVYEVNAQIQSQLSNLLARLDPLMGTWQGSAATSFQVLKQRWHEDATKLNLALRGIGDGLVQSHGNYQRSEETNQQGFSSISSRLG
ncbi:MAG: WXG100 family type VII secretion target [Candidatus Dormibacteraeota bacterium]|nr:WXG100 family type VII secretion target [Candidatus Dormibacteraeota bacterium]MDQ6900275.1 WXG100 family type VII secretion target [Candidatus Dormibacteraeota bacterium]